MPDTTWPINGHPPDSSRDRFDTPVSMSPVSLSTRLQRFAYASPSRSPPDTSRAPFPHRSPQSRYRSRSMWRFEAPPQGDSEGPTILHLLHSTTSGSTAYTGHSLPRSGHTETVIQPHRVPDDLDRIPVALIPRRNRHNDQSSQPPHKVNNLTMPVRVCCAHDRARLAGSIAGGSAAPRPPRIRVADYASRPAPAR